MLVLSGGASASPPTTLALCINPGGNVTSVTSPDACGPNKTEFTAVSAASQAALQAQVNALQSQEAQDVAALQQAIGALQSKEATDIATLQAAANADESNDTSELAAVQSAEQTDANTIITDGNNIAALQTTVHTDETNFTALQTNVNSDETADAPIEAKVAAITGIVNGLIDTINNVIITPLNSVICGLSLGTDCSAITPLSHI